MIFLVLFQLALFSVSVSANDQQNFFGPKKNVSSNISQDTPKFNEKLFNTCLLTTGTLFLSIVCPPCIPFIKCSLTVKAISCYFSLSFVTKMLNNKKKISEDVCQKNIPTYYDTYMTYKSASETDLARYIKASETFRDALMYIKPE